MCVFVSVSESLYLTPLAIIVMCIYYTYVCYNERAPIVQQPLRIFQATVSGVYLFMWPCINASIYMSVLLILKYCVRIFLSLAFTLVSISFLRSVAMFIFWLWKLGRYFIDVNVYRYVCDSRATICVDKFRHMVQINLLLGKKKKRLK